MFGAITKDTAISVAGVDLQDELMRFEGRFASRLDAAFEPILASADPPARQRAARDELEFMSAALEIAVGAAPEVDILDMVTLVVLGNDAMASRWSVDQHGALGQGVADAFRASVEDITTVARKVVSGDLEAELYRIIREWQRENPDQQAVAGVRLSDYAERRASALSGAAGEAAGLFSFVRGAAKTADTAVLLGERALYVMQRLPFFIRMHTRIGGNDLIVDGMAPASDLIARVERSVNRVLLRTFLAGSAIAVVGAASWLSARVGYRWFRERR
jgi:hypothetical protein